MPELLDQVSSCWAPTFSPPAEYLCIHRAYYGIVGGVCAFSGQSFFNRASALGISAPQRSQIQTLFLSALTPLHLGHSLSTECLPILAHQAPNKETCSAEQLYPPPRASLTLLFRISRHGLSPPESLAKHIVLLNLNPRFLVRPNLAGNRHYPIPDTSSS